MLTLSPMFSEFAGEFSNAHHMKLAHAMTSAKKYPLFFQKLSCTPCPRQARRTGWRRRQSDARNDITRPPPTVLGVQPLGRRQTVQ